MADNLAKRIVAALKNGPVSYRELLKKLDYETGIDEALLVLSDAGEARRFTNWQMYGGDIVEYWTLTLTATNRNKAGA